MDKEQVETLGKIYEKTLQLIELCEALREQNDLLNLDNQSLRVALETSQKKNKSWQEKYQTLELLGSISVKPENSIDFKQKINKFVEEIERCIDLIHQ
jgi:regulator of replication initiation timing